MLTARGFWFLVLVLVLLLVGVGIENATLGVLGLTLLLWFLWEWLVFALRVHGVVPRLRVDRQMRDERGRVESLWAGRTFEVRVRLRLAAGFRLPYLRVSERVPFGVEKARGRTDFEGAVAADRPVEFRYAVLCPTVGRVRFEGLAVQVADLQGFFYHATFLSSPRVYRVLPPLADARGHVPAVKRHNLLPLLGIHRHRRPGSGSELLDLRDYMPGDPPKTIAWKPSARRDRLMTKEFESEVPVRCTLFVDTSGSVRVGPPGRNALARLIEISAAVAQASGGARDPTGLCLFDEQEATSVKPARGPRHLVQLLNRLAEAGGRAPATGKARLKPLLAMGYALAQELYPGQLRPDINRVPWWLPWLWPQPLYAIRRPGFVDRVNAWLFGLLAVAWGAGLAFMIWLVERAFRDAPLTTATLFGRVFLWLVFAVLALGGFLASLALLRGYLLFLPSRRRTFRWRKQMAALLSVRHGLDPGGLAVLLEDDERMGLHLQRFLAEHQVPYPLPLYDRRGRYLFAAPEKVDVLARALLGAVGKGHDNELFVLLADLLELEDHLGPLLRAVKVARARHHRVLVICPWPPGVRPPGQEEEKDGKGEAGQGGKARLRHALRQTTRERFHRAYHLLRRTFARLGVPVLCAREGDPARLILQQLDQLRLQGRWR